MMEISTITFDESAYHILCKLLEVKEKKCHYCNKKVTKRDIGGFFGNPIKMCCNKPLCLFELANTSKQSKQS